MKGGLRAMGRLAGLRMLLRRSLFPFGSTLRCRSARLLLLFVPLVVKKQKPRHNF